MAITPTLPRPKGMTAVMACLTFFSLTQGLGYPLLALRLKAAGHDEAAIGLSGSATAIGVLIAGLFLPAAVRRWGAQRSVLSCACLGVAIWMLFPLLDHYWVWFFLRFLQGAAATGAYVVGEIWLNQVVEPTKRGRSIALYGTVLSIGFGIGPLILSLVGTTGFAPFLVGALGCLLTVAAVVFLAGDLPQRPPPSPEGGGRAWQVCLSIWPLLVIIVLISFFDQAVLSLVPVFGIAKGMEEAAAALMVTAMVIGHIALQVPLGHLADRIGPLKVIMYCGFAAGLLSLSLVYLIGHSWLAWPALFLWGAAGFSIYMLGLAELGRRFSDDRLVTASSAYGFSWGIGGLMGPVATGWFMTQVGNEGLFWVLAAGLAAIGFLVFFRRQGS